MTRKTPDQTPTDVARLVIVDDHPVVRRGLTGLINEEADLDVVAEAEDFNSALEAITEHEPAVAIIDLNLSSIGGLDLIKQVKVSWPDLRILVLSMHDEKLYAERALRAGAQGYIMKQEGPKRLVDAIRTVLRGEIYVSEQMSSRMLNKLITGQPGAGGSPLERLSDRELEVFELLGRGLSTRQIADRLCISVKTVESHREHIKDKLDIKNASELVQQATQWVISEGTS